MQKIFSEFIHFIFDQNKAPSAKERRSLLINEMNVLENKSIDCLSCRGTCCTFVANSMKVTPLEALEIIMALAPTQERAAELKLLMQKNIQHYRLDHEIFLGKKNQSTLRKTYTCPFFLPGPKGCSVKKEYKPYGCLGFNPLESKDNGAKCFSDNTLLENRENLFRDTENQINELIKNKLQLDWEKTEIPKAVLTMLNIFF